MKAKTLLALAAIFLLIGITAAYLQYGDEFLRQGKLPGKNKNITQQEAKNKISQNNLETTLKPQKVTPIPTSEPQKLETEKNEAFLKINVVGDIMMGRGVTMRVMAKGGDYTSVLSDVAPILKSGDVVFGNVEASFTDRTKGLVGISQGGKYVLKNPMKSFEAFKMCGFNLISLANNHILDYYKEGVQDTFSILDRNKIAYSGVGRNLDTARKPAIIEKNGQKIGLLSYTDMSEVVYKGSPPLMFLATDKKFGVAPKKLIYILEDIKKARSQVDILMVSMHWGIEESFEIADYQVKMAHEIIDSGADIILGHHPHQFQGIEIYNEKPIFYSLGNFIFDQGDPENQESFIVQMEYKGTKLSNLNLVPVRTLEKSKVVAVKGKDAEALLKRQEMLCAKLDAKTNIARDRLIFAIK